jgi:glycosyltransferase involved in cell wall biosynthesis
VLVLCVGPSDYSYIGAVNKETQGIKDGVAFRYTCGTTIRGKTLFQQRWLVLKGLVAAARLILSLNRKNDVDAIYLYADRGLVIFFFWIVAKLCKNKYFYERNEQPFYQAEHSFFWKVVSFLFTNTLYRLFDGAIVISDYLMGYMRKRMRADAGLLKIPILVDVARFSTAELPAPIPGKYMAYCGSWVEAQHGMHNMMKAFAKISKEFPDLKFVLIGDSEKRSSIPTYRSYAEELAIADQVIFPGFLSGSDLIAYLTNASILVLTLPAGRQSEAGFPNKLGEYLATGKPVLATKTIQISEYLKDNHDIFLAPPDDTDAFAERLRYILLHQDEAISVGKRGREVALRYFDYKDNGKKIKAFFEEICKN